MYNFQRLIAVPLLFMALALSAAERTIGDLTFTYTAGSTEASVRMRGSSESESESKIESVTIPSSVTIDGTTYKVTSIDDHGFTAHGFSPSGYWYEGKTYTCYRTNYANFNLKEVNFELPSNIRHIGQGAFQGCVYIENIVIPNSVETMGTEAFTECYSMKSVKFQTDADGRVKLKALPRNAFFLCKELTALSLPEGIESIADYALQDLLSLKSIHLPNTLKTIGGHFLCNARKLTTLTVPASVTSIDGAFLHGCESLRTVYMLGRAATLSATFTAENESTSNSFEAFPNKDGGTVSTAPSSKKVNNCKFYVPSDYYDSYLSSSVWRQLDKANNSDGNEIITPLPGGERVFGAEKWQTAIFYNGVESYKSVLGEGCMVARFTGATLDSSDPYRYHLEFTLIDGVNIPAKEPLLIWCGERKTTVMFNPEDEKTEEFKAFYNKPYVTEVKVDGEEGTSVQMIGMGCKLDLQKWDFYFKWDADKKKGNFLRVPDDGKGINKTAFGCYWRIVRDGMQTDIAGLDLLAPSRPGTTGISGTMADGARNADVRVYDLNGRLVSTSADALAKGLYIIGGRKVAVK